LTTELNRLKQKLRFCGNKKQDIQETFMDVIHSDIPAFYFLGARVNQYLDYDS
jgi:hypothetical protein